MSSITMSNETIHGIVHRVKRRSLSFLTETQVLIKIGGQGRVGTIDGCLVSSESCGSLSSLRSDNEEEDDHYEISELSAYLFEGTFKERRSIIGGDGNDQMDIVAKYNVLKWWSSYGIAYLILSEIVKDMLVIPISTYVHQISCEVEIVFPLTRRISQKKNKNKNKSIERCCIHFLFRVKDFTAAIQFTVHLLPAVFQYLFGIEMPNES
ncbi:hypothetical protein LINPERPRIM_LOCUS32970 [Linum perenne]